MAAQIQRAIVKGRLVGTVATRSMFVAQVDVVPADTRQTVWGTYLFSIYNPLATYISTVWSGETILLQKYDNGTYEDLEEFAFTYQGQASGDALANLVAAVLIGKAPGKRLMGRKFISGLAESAVNGNSLTTAALAAFADAAGHYISYFQTANGSSFGPGIIAKDGTYHAFLSGWVSSLLGTMRRRKPGLGI